MAKDKRGDQQLRNQLLREGRVVSSQQRSSDPKTSQALAIAARRAEMNVATTTTRRPA